MKPLLLLSVLAATLVPAGQEQPFDLLIVNARLLDGSGNPWFREDLATSRRPHCCARPPGGIKGDARDRRKGPGRRPGFIDVHSHAVGALRALSCAMPVSCWRRA